MTTSPSSAPAQGSARPSPAASAPKGFAVAVVSRSQDRVDALAADLTSGRGDRPRLRR